MDLKFIVDEFGIDSDKVNSDLSLSEAYIPKQQANGKIYSVDKTLRCVVLYKEISNQGRYGLIQKCERIGGNSMIMAVKRPRSPSISLAPEAILQNLCYHVLTKNGIAGSIPKPYDIFVLANEVRFTMEYVDGISFRTLLKRSETIETIEKTFINCLMQLCFILFYLGRDLNFDHRDLRIENIWIRPLQSEVEYTVTIDEVVYRLPVKNQVVLLDFGFACIGNSLKASVVNLGDGVFSKFDPCPKVGRDLYQFFNSCFEIKEIAGKFSGEFMEQIKNWMAPYKIGSQSFSYLITSDVKFKKENLNPVELIRWGIKA